MFYLPRTVSAIANDVVTRGAQAGPGESSHNAMVKEEVSVARRHARQETTNQIDDPFSLDDVRDVIHASRSSSKTLRLPRTASKNDMLELLWANWGILCLVAVTGLIPSEWVREITPIRKRGPQVVTVLTNLRPVSYVSALQGFFDAAWLYMVRRQLQDYAGIEQAGGRYDSVLMMLGIVIALQLRHNLGLPSLLEKIDLLQGFDLCWRDAVRLHCEGLGYEDSIG